MTVPKKPRIAVDIGGTFTDIAIERAIETGAEILSAKTLTTPERPVDGVIQGIGYALEQAALEPSAFGAVIHGTTLATNALIERRGAAVGVIATAGFRDILEIGYERRYDQYDLYLDKPDMIVPRDRIFPVGERIDANGAVIEPLDEDSLAAAVEALLAAGVESVAVCLLHSYRNALHEHRVRDAIAERAPGLPVSLSSEVSPEVREFDRLSTTVANAYIKPLDGGLLAKTWPTALEVSEASAVRFFIITSGGGMTTLETATAFPIRLVESGPSGGAILAAKLAAERDLQRRPVVRHGRHDGQGLPDREWRRRERRDPSRSGAPSAFSRAAAYRCRIPVIEMIEIGAGGGSIASRRRLSAGYGSARRARPPSPGPACYGRGGNGADGHRFRPRRSATSIPSLLR